MCGILFYDASCAVATSAEEVGKLVAAAGAHVKHRGPDASRTRFVGGHALVFHRLAIIATEGDAGMQPFFTPNGGAAMVCSGEVYNFRELLPPEEADACRSDVDVVLGLLAGVLDDAAEAARRVARLDGDFAFVCTDGTSVVAGRDPFGVRPLFYLSDSDAAIVAIASEAKALLLAPLGDMRAQGSRVRVFPPGHVLVGGRFVRYFFPAPPQPGVPPDTPHTHKLTEATFRALLERAVEKRVRHGERAVGVLCSGGIDSAVITSLAARLPERDSLHVFTMQYGGGRSDDAFYASLMCQRLGLRHTIVRFDASEFGVLEEVIAALETRDPNTVRAALPMYLLARHIARHTNIKVVLSGEGADELLGGYGYIRLAPSPEAAAAESDRLLGNLHMFDLLRADRCFAAFGLEVRVPFLDAELVRRGVPPGCRAPDGRGVEKRLLRDAFAHLDELRECRILERPKEKFSDGTGFCYVPDLLRHLAAACDDGTLRTRLAAEGAHYSSVFARLYGTVDLVVERRLPDWGEAERERRGDEAVGLVEP
jgi:asparagine synthase (glutamine-hydrolysing)